MENEELKCWVLTHDSHKLKKGDTYEGVDLPAWLNGKAVPASKASQRSAADLETEKELRDEILRLTDEGEELKMRLGKACERTESLSAERKQLSDENEQMQKAIADLQGKLKKQG